MSEQKTRTNIYAKQGILKTFKKICKREGTNMSAKLENFMLNYNQAHTPGNPQLTMANYVKPDDPQPMRVKCAFIGGATSEGKVYCRWACMWVPGVRCYSCEKNQLRKG